MPVKDSVQERYRLLLEAARKIFAVNNVDQIVYFVLRHATAILKCERVSMYIPNNDTRELILYSSLGSHDKVNSIHLPWDKGIAGACFQTLEKFKIDDGLNDPRIYRPVEKEAGIITRAMMCYPLSDKGDTFGVLQAINPIGSPCFTDLDTDIFEGLTNIVTGALVRFDRETKIKASTQIERELNLAVEIQRSFLPPEDTDLLKAEFLVRYRPARSLGGDFYAVFPLEQERLLVAIGDVSGKGIPAALTTAQITSEMRALLHVAQEGLAPYICALNDSLCQRLFGGRFAATTFLLYDPLRNLMDVVCAGQFAPLVCRGDEWVLVSVPSDLPLGIFHGRGYTATSIPTQPGEKWLLWSDGINEGRSAVGNEYGMDRLNASLKLTSPEQTLKHAWAEWLKFVDQHHQHDDACLAILGTKPAPALSIASCSSQCKMARRFVEGWAQAAGFTDVQRGGIALAMDEAVTNIMRHTYKSAPSCAINVSAEITAVDLRFTLRDFGPPVDPATLKGRDLDNIKPGGLGLHIIQTQFPTFEHRALSDGNEWLLMKPLPFVATV